MRSVSLHLLIVFVASLLVGCGGGGGGGSTGAKLVYTTDWSSMANPGQITGKSQRVFLTSSTTSYSTIINHTSSGKQSATLSGLSNGTYHLTVTLFSDLNAGGTSTGSIDQDIAISGSTSYSTAVGEQPTSVRVTPATATVTIPESVRYYAAALGPTRTPTFTTSGQFVWSALGGVATVNQSGLASGGTAGTGSIRATMSGAIGSAEIVVLPVSTATAKWTVLVFLNAANDLTAFDTYNINQMVAAAGNSDVRFVVQWKQASGYWDANPDFIGTRRYLISKDSSNKISTKLIQDLGTGVDMGSATTLNDFLRWGKTYYPATRYCVVIWDHGNGWHRSASANQSRGVSYDDETGNHIDTWQLAQGLGGTKWDIVSWDASLMQMMEVAYEIQDQAKYVVGSEESPPGAGLPYDTIFAKFRDNPDASTETLTKAFVDGMVNDTSYTGEKITQSVINVTKLPALRVSLTTLANALIAHKAAYTTEFTTIRNTAKSYSQNSSRWFYDIYDLCEKIKSNVAFSDVSAAATDVQTKMTACVVWEGHNSNSALSHGLSIDFSPATAYNGTTEATDYPQMRFGQDSTWKDWLSVAP